MIYQKKIQNIVLYYIQTSTKYATFYIARMGGTTLDGNRTVSKQFLVVLFKSANYVTWLFGTK